MEFSKAEHIASAIRSSEKIGSVAAVADLGVFQLVND